MTAIGPMISGARNQWDRRPSDSFSGTADVSKAPNSSTRASSTASSIRCPGCGMPSLRQIHHCSGYRFLRDSVRLCRFECDDHYCQWIGNLTEHSGLATSPVAMSTPMDPPAGPTRSLLSVALLCVVGFSLIWLLGHDFFPNFRDPEGTFTKWRIPTSPAAHPSPEALQSLVHGQRANSDAAVVVPPGWSE